MIVTWEWDSAAAGTALSGVVPCRDRATARCAIEARLREAGALSALACEVAEREPTGNAMIARLADPVLKTFTWRDVREGAARPIAGIP